MKKNEQEEILREIRIGNKKLSDQIEELADEVHDMHGAMNAFSSETDRRFIRIEALMVTKDYLDRKYADWRNDIVNQVKSKIPEWVKVR